MPSSNKKTGPFFRAAAISLSREVCYLHRPPRRLETMRWSCWQRIPPLPGLIESGASGAVVGLPCDRPWFGRKDIRRFHRHGIFDSATGKLVLVPDNERQNYSFSHAAKIRKRVGRYLRRQTFRRSTYRRSTRNSHWWKRMGGLDFTVDTLQIRNGFSATLHHLSIGHICLPEVPVAQVSKSLSQVPGEPVAPNTVYAMHTPQKLLPTKDDMAKIHRHLARCIEYTSANLLKAGMRVVEKAKKRRIPHRCIIGGLVGRVILRKSMDGRRGLTGNYWHRGNRPIRLSQRRSRGEKLHGHAHG